jgi:hypothetical protein
VKDSVPPSARAAQRALLLRVGAVQQQLTSISAQVCCGNAWCSGCRGGGCTNTSSRRHLQFREAGAWHAVSSTHSDHLHIQVAALVEAGNSSLRNEDAQAAQLLKMLDQALLALDDVSLQLATDEGLLSSSFHHA